MQAMATAQKADMVAYLLQMTYLECSDVLRGTRPMRVAGDPARDPVAN